LRQPEPARLPTANELEVVLQRHVIDTWFPRCIDDHYGGFLCDFDRAWRPCGTHDKLLEFQARQTWFAAEALQHAPHDERLRQAALHGFRCLRDVMWDHKAGGWFHRTDRAGGPLEARTKHVHGTAYAIAACTAVHVATGEVDALPLAREGFLWLEQYAHDKKDGGYFGFFTQNGTVIRDPFDCPWPAETDTIDTPIGLKDGNVHSDLLQTLTYLYRVWPDPKVAERLREIARLLCDKMLLSHGALFFFCQPDWKPTPHLMRYGYSFQLAHRLLAARDVLDAQEKIIGIARRIEDFALRQAWDAAKGGFFYAGPSSPPARLEDTDLLVRKKAWWVQFEALKALLTLGRVVEDNGIYLRAFAVLWRYLHGHFIDNQYGGFYTTGLENLPHWRRRLGARFAPRDFTRKGSVWKDGSHDGRALLSCLTLLRNPNS
jgi:mannobiose 2-epimerase